MIWKGLACQAFPIFNSHMGKLLRLPTLFANLILVIGLVLLWVFLAPTKIGGQASYVIIQGHSMEPKFHSGDLALVRKASSYNVGDIVTYWNDSMAAYTIHRIIDIKQDRFILKGDNNSWIDPVYPSQEEIIGKLWIHLPKLGKLMEKLRSPANFALVMGLSGGLLMTGMVLSSKRNRKKEFINLNPGGAMAIGLYTLGLLFFAFLALSFYAFSRPVSISSNNVVYQQEGQFSYSATGTPGIYDSNTVQPGEPIFPKLTCILNVGFNYNLLGNQAQAVSGNHQFYARVLDEQSGWSRTIPMSQVMTFNGASFFNAGTIDLCQVEALVATLERETGLRSNTYVMEVVSAVEITADVAGEAVSDSFVPVLTFKFDEAHFYLDSNKIDDNVLHTSQSGMSNSPNLQANVLPLLGLNPTVQTVRIISILGLFISLSGLLIVGFYIYQAVQQNQEALIHLKYGTLLVDIYDGAYEPAPPIIDVTSIDNLAKLAERHNTMILHIPRDFLHDYIVQGINVTYRFSISTRTNNSVPARMPIQPEMYGVAWVTKQSQLASTQPTYRDSVYWNENQPYYDLDDTQPTKTAQRRYESSTYRDDLAHDEVHQTMFLRK
jgi:signal peptidase I